MKLYNILDTSNEKRLQYQFADRLKTFKKNNNISIHIGLGIKEIILKIPYVLDMCR